MQIQKKFEGGAVGSRGAEKCSEMGVRVHHIQKFNTLTADRRLSIHVLKGCAAFLYSVIEGQLLLDSAALKSATGVVIEGQKAEWIINFVEGLTGGTCPRVSFEKNNQCSRVPVEK